MGGEKMKKQKQPLSQAEMWDDSALVQSWDDALGEYKKYHSLHAQGQKINDMIGNFDDSNNQAGTGDDTVQIDPDGVDIELLEDGELREGENEELSNRPGNDAFQNSNYQQASGQDRHDQHSSIPPAPVAMSNGIQDEALKNLMMSWYYAGYYTGLYEGHASPVGCPKK